MKLKLEKAMKKKHSAKFSVLNSLFLQEPDLQNCFSGLGGRNSFEDPIEFPSLAKTRIMSKVLSIIAVQERELYRFDGNIIQKIMKRKLEKYIYYMLLK